MVTNVPACVRRHQICFDVAPAMIYTLSAVIISLVSVLADEPVASGADKTDITILVHHAIAE